ncbi:hypothetical protein DFH06DRAFT_1125131 [Mycena polygramma]|nr:hypothetical protein DFH06DRAFT_1125131 [Mycena polygramma]
MPYVLPALESVQITECLAQIDVPTLIKVFAAPRFEGGHLVIGQVPLQDISPQAIREMLHGTLPTILQKIRAGQVLAQRAANGAVDALSDFLSRLSDFPEHSALALPVVFVQLDNSKIPSPAEMDSLVPSPERLPDWADFAPIIGAVLCVHGISRMIFNSVVSPGSYADLWSRLYRWIIFLDIYYQHVPPHLRVSVPMHTCAASCTILIAFGRHEHTSDLVQRSPGVRTIFAKQWSALVENHGTVVHEGIVPSNPDGWRDIYAILLFLSTDEQGRNLEEMANGVGGGPPRAAARYRAHGSTAPVLRLPCPSR